MSEKDMSWLKKHSKYTLHMSSYEAHECKEIIERTGEREEVVLNAMIAHKQSIEFRLYAMRLPEKFANIPSQKKRTI